MAKSVVEEGGTGWQALVRYTRNVETKGFTVSLHKHCFSYDLISPVFCSTVRHGVDQDEEGFLVLTSENLCVPSLEALRRVLCPVIDSEDHDVSFVDGISHDEGRIGNELIDRLGW